VLAAAGNIFRQRGYRDASIAELERATGLVSGSIYNAFGDKAGLFRAALEHYVHGFVRQQLERFAGDGATLEDLEELLLSVLRPPLADGYGCLVTNSIIEFGREPGIAADGIGETLDTVRAGLEGVLSREIGSARAPVEAMQLLLLYHGILTLSRSTTSMDAMADAVRAAFTRLRALRNQIQPQET
jgi:AcrR family transcriptional regulator